MSLGERLLELRKSKHLSQEELAFKLDVTRQTISNWETDQSTPDFDKIMPLCELYGITSDELLTGLKKEEEVKESNSNEVSNKSKRLGLVISIFLFFVAIAWMVLADESLKLPDGISVPVFLLIIAAGVCIIVYNYAGTSKKKDKEEKKDKTIQQKTFEAIKGIIAIIVLIIYLGISFLTGMWYITWIIWPIFAVIIRIVELCFLLKGDDVSND